MDKFKLLSPLVVAIIKLNMFSTDTRYQPGLPYQEIIGLLPEASNHRLPQCNGGYLTQ